MSWKAIGRAISKGVSDVGSEVKRDINRVSGNDKPDPMKFSTPSGAPMNSPINTGPQTPIGPPGGSSGGAGGFGSQSAVESQLRNQFGVGDILDTIGRATGDVWGWIEQHIPIPAGAVHPDGSIDWGALGLDAVKAIGSYLKDNKDTIISGLSAYNDYERQKQSDKYAKEGLDLAKQHYEEKAPLRTAGMAGMLDPQANTPDISGLRSQSQNGLPIAAPVPVPAARTNMNAAQSIAGAGSGNPFAKPTAPTSLPIASPIPSGPSLAPGVPSRPTPSLPAPLPIGGLPNGGGRVPTGVPSGPMTSLPVAQSGPLVPQDKQWSTQPVVRRPIVAPPGAPANPLDPNTLNALPIASPMPSPARY